MACLMADAAARASGADFRVNYIPITVSMMPPPRASGADFNVA